MLDDGGLASPGDEDDLFDPRLARFIHRILDQRPVYDRQQFLRDRLGRRKETCAETRYGENGFLDGFMLAHRDAIRRASQWRQYCR